MVVMVAIAMSIMVTVAWHASENSGVNGAGVAHVGAAGGGGNSAEGRGDESSTTVAGSGDASGGQVIG